MSDKKAETVKVKVTGSIAGHTRSYKAGDIADLPLAEAERWISHGIAEAITTVGEETENQKLRADLAQARAALAQRDAAAPAPAAKK